MATNETAVPEGYRGRAIPAPLFEFENGAVLLALKQKSGSRLHFTVLCYWPTKEEYVVWSYNHEDGGLYWGHYTDIFEAAARIYDSKN